jgi:acetate kinase
VRRVRILVINSGSSSLKFQVAEVRPNRPRYEVRPVASGLISRIGGAAEFELTEDVTSRQQGQRMIPGHLEAVQWMFEVLGERGADKVEAVGHRVVHGGDLFRNSVRLDATVLERLEALSELAPLHNPASVAGIKGVQTILGTAVPMVAVFDTAFHCTLPLPAAVYAIPPELAARHHIRRYGFHGIAHASLAEGYAACTGHPLAGRRLITLQLGNGCSITAIREGRSVDTSMGFTPLEGLVMGTRSGDLDPAIVAYLAKREGVSADVIEQWLNERSGLLGLSGLSRDMRQLLEAEAHGHQGARLAIELFCYRAQKYLGAYLAVLGGADAVVFGGGIGEHASSIRARICEGMDWCGLLLDADANAGAIGLTPGSGTRISSSESHLAAYVVAADEETFIARETARVIQADGHTENPDR